jgi:hypothetical protein
MHETKLVLPVVTCKGTVEYLRGLAVQRSAGRLKWELRLKANFGFEGADCASAN